MGGRWDNAGHLLGFAAECAIKFAIVELRSGQGAPRKHMPELVDDAKKCFHGRVKKHGDIKKVVQLPTYFSGWDVSDRYRPDDAVDEAAYSQWHEHARRTLGAVKLLGRR